MPILQGMKLFSDMIDAFARAEGPPPDRLWRFMRWALAGIALPNDASVALHESFGFERAGLYRDVGYKAGAWRSVGWWQLQLARELGDPLQD